MTTDQLKQIVGNYKWTFIVAIALFAMVIFGYQLARVVDQGDSKKVAAQNETIAILSNENNTLTTRVNQLEVALELAKRETDSMTKKVSEQKKELEAQQELLTFYERVMAPEKSEAMLAIEGVEVFRIDKNRFQLRMVLLQSRQQKTVINGNLKVSLQGTKEGRELRLISGETPFLSEDIKYRFRFFQAINVEIALPEGFEPDTILFSSSVYQYKTRKETFELSVPWEQALAVELE